MRHTRFRGGYSRRDVLHCGLYGIGVTSGVPPIPGRASQALATGAVEEERERHSHRILVVVELTGGNDGLNTIVPYRDDVYYRARPNLAIPKNQVIAVTDEAGFHPSLAGFERLYKSGQMAVVEGCGYPNPILSHFASMRFWHTGVRDSVEALGWVGRFADASTPPGTPNPVIHFGGSQSLAVRGEVHTPLVFDNSEQRRWESTDEDSTASRGSGRNRDTPNPALRWARATTADAMEIGAQVRDACTSYRTPVDYGRRSGFASDLRRVAALIAADLPLRVYYVSYRGNRFDTHVHQADLHSRLLLQTADAVNSFAQDVERLGRGDDVAVLMFTEFGRRLNENGSQGTDHGTAGPMFIVGKGVQGGFYGRAPSLTDLDHGHLKMTTDFRCVYATMISEWMGCQKTASILKGEFAPLGVYS